MLKSMRISAGILTAVALAGCAVDGGDLIRSGESSGVIEVVNGSSAVITAVLISDCDNFTYGFNRLPDGTSIKPGESYAWNVSAGCWDVDAGYGWGTGYAEARQKVTVSAGGTVRYTVTD